MIHYNLIGPMIIAIVLIGTGIIMRYEEGLGWEGAFIMGALGIILGLATYIFGAKYNKHNPYNAAERERDAFCREHPNFYSVVGIISSKLLRTLIYTLHMAIVAGAPVLLVFAIINAFPEAQTDQFFETLEGYPSFIMPILYLVGLGFIIKRYSGALSFITRFIGRTDEPKAKEVINFCNEHLKETALQAEIKEKILSTTVSALEGTFRGRKISLEANTSGRTTLSLSTTNTLHFQISKRTGKRMLSEDDLRNTFSTAFQIKNVSTSQLPKDFKTLLSRQRRRIEMEVKEGTMSFHFPNNPFQTTEGLMAFFSFMHKLCSSLEGENIEIPPTRKRQKSHFKRNTIIFSFVALAGLGATYFLLIYDGTPETRYEGFTHYSRTEQKVYFKGSSVSGADPLTFQPFADVWDYGKDEDHVFYQQKTIHDADPNSFQILDEKYARDAQNLYYKDEKAEEVDFESFVIFSEYYARDANKIYYKGLELPNSDAKTFAYLDQEYARDQNTAYYRGIKIRGSDGKSFKTLGDNYASDVNTVYHRGEKISGADPQSFKSFGQHSYLAADKDTVYCRGEKRSGISPEQLENLTEEQRDDAC